MIVHIGDPDLAERLKAQRRESGSDRYDEVWDGIYFMPPLANDEHQSIASRLGAAVQFAVGWDGPHAVYVGVNVSDREKDWETNYRIPDVAVFLAGTHAKDCDTHWWGGPDFAVEVISPGDRSRDKFAFYAKVGVRELLLIDRYPWQLELYRLQNKKLRRVGLSSLKKPSVVRSKVLPLAVRLMPGGHRPLIEVTHSDGVQHWRI